MPEISRRAESLGTENAFVVLAEVNKLAREGKDIVSFCIGQPDFPAPLNVQEAAIRAIREGKHGYGITEDSYNGTGLEIIVPFDDSWIAAYHAETRYHMRVQIGRTVGDARFLYFPNLSFADTPEKVSVGGRDGLKLSFTALERDVAQGSMTAAQYHRARAKFVLGRVA